MPTNQPAGSETPIRVIVGDRILTARLWDNATARDLIAQLPLTLTFRDFNGVEKLAQLPRKLSMNGVPPGDDPSPRDIGYYAPSSVVVFYYDDVGYFTGIVHAGVLHETPLLDLTDAEIAESIAVHLTGPMRLIRRLVPAMVTRGYGRIVNLSSDWGLFGEGLGGPGLYGVTKAALNALTVRLAKELPAAVKVNAMCPGWVQTRMGGQGATRTPAEAADTAVWLATLPDGGPTGGFFRDRKPIKW